MFMKPDVLRCVVILLIVCFVCTEGNKSRRIIRYSDAFKNNLSQTFDNRTSKESVGRGFFSHGGLFSLGKVLNFFPVGGERECRPEGQTLARAGICLNPYDCRQRDGKAAGDCAHGLGVCCVFEVTCGGVVQNNLTYFMSPGFPDLWHGDQDCDVTVEKTHAGIMQLRIDFVHFTIGQPNRTTGECDEDALIIGEGATNFTVCGQNHGQHLYYNLPSGSVSREADELPTTMSTRIRVRAHGADTPRLWLLRLAQLPLAHSAPHGCLQHYTDNNGTIKTFNYAVNGRHLASHDYKACIRRNTGFCAIRYSPCDPRSFRIGPSSDAPLMNPTDSPQMGEMMPADQTQDDTIEGSGAEPGTDGAVATPAPAPSLASRIWRFMWPSWLWGQRRARSAAWSPARSRRSRSWSRWSPYVQHLGVADKLRYYGYGYFGSGVVGHGRLRCADRVTIPCESEYFVASSVMSPGVCDPHHCGSSFCAAGRSDCRVDSSISPFTVSVHFGPPTHKRDPDENIGACLRYSQLPCDT
ncbi:PREDICTED: uncharacterized protein LOC106126626 [Papilio xuthus]|uniref:Uncharacterized protein LOC106126626 n=1 Tax=Papilio xuthus TaxID=66420 RepID=A0AAJ7EJL4_PAPXU|nr:PREDICTED: uncharacterized protein LOC106126626 [Papilio xuthus]